VLDGSFRVRDLDVEPFDEIGVIVRASERAAALVERAAE